MKKWIFLLVCCWCTLTLFAQEESRLIINPGRETFVHFPSASLGNRYTVTFFLPEPRVPLAKNYPVIVMLGLTPKHAARVADFQQKNKALVVGINFTEDDYATYADEIVTFLSRELLPYVDTNYWTQTGPEHRLLVANGKGAARIALRVTQNPQLYGGLFLADTQDVWEEKLLPAVRTLVVGEQSELALAQMMFEMAGKQYGPDFALRYYTQEGEDWSVFNPAYLWAPAGEVQLQSVRVALSARKLALKDDGVVSLRAWALLANGDLFHYVPVQLRFSPPYLRWNPLLGTLRVIPGAAAGTVRVRSGVDKPAFSTKIKLKK